MNFFQGSALRTIIFTLVVPYVAAPHFHDELAIHLDPPPNHQPIFPGQDLFDSTATASASVTAPIRLGLLPSSLFLTIA
jgi:hypothetical protein